MASLYEIMREQEDEKLARQLYAQNALYAKEEELFNSELDDEELARRLQEQYGGYIEQHMPQKETKEPVQETDEELARRLQEEFDRIDNGHQSAEDDTAAQVDPAEFEDDETAALQYDEDERLAYEMQNVERSEVSNVHPRQFNAVEERYATLRPMHVDENGDEPDDEYYQDLADQDIAFVYRRFPEKLNAQSDEPKVLHYQTYSTRNTGKRGESKTKKKITKAGRELIKQFRVKEEGFEYGVVLGRSHDRAYCYDGVVRKVHFYKKIRATALITRGALVLLKIRAYQDEIADVVHIYEKEEVSRLYEMGEITQLDPVLHLPPEVLYTVLNYMEDERTTATLSLLNRAWNAIVQKEFEKEINLPNFEAQANRITWGNLKNFHRRFMADRVDGVSTSQHFCRKSRYERSVDSPCAVHFNLCKLTEKVLDVANNLWNDLQASRGNKDSERNDNDNDDASSDDEVLGLGLPSDKPPFKSSKDLPVFTGYKVLHLLFDDEELINYSATVLWTWWIIHKRKDLDQRPDTIDVLIRATLLRMLRRSVDPIVKNYEHDIERMEDKKDKRYLTAKRELEAFKRYWDLVLNPPSIYKVSTYVEAQLSDDDD
jgi:initiation factor 1A